MAPQPRGLHRTPPESLAQAGCHLPSTLKLERLAECPGWGTPAENLCPAPNAQTLSIPHFTPFSKNRELLAGAQMHPSVGSEGPRTKALNLPQEAQTRTRTLTAATPSESSPRFLSFFPHL